MIILCDTREQAPLPFKAGGAVEGIEAATLSVGDYQVRFKDGSIPPVAIERKSIGDLFGTMTSGYPRFKKEVLRAHAGGIKLLLLVEGTLTEVLEGWKHSTFSGESMVQKLFTLQIRYDLQIVFCKSRQEMVRWIEEYFCSIGREMIVRGKLHKNIVVDSKTGGG